MMLDGGESGILGLIVGATGSFVLLLLVKLVSVRRLPRILKPCDCPTCLVARDHARWRKQWAEHNL